MQRHQDPVVSIGLPVHNGENYLEAALDSILSQTFADFELIVADNCSSDGTGAICQAYAAGESRICYRRHHQNIGAAANFNYTLHRARGRYFKWAAHDDLLAPDFLARCIEVLEKDPAVVLCQSQVGLIDARGDLTCIQPQAADLQGADRPHQRFKALILNDRNCHEVFGVIRSSGLQRTQGIAPFIASDRVLRAHLGFLGRFYEIQDPLFFSRDHRQRSIRAMPAHHLRGAWFSPAAAGRRVLPHWRIWREYGAIIDAAQVSPVEKQRCRAHLVRWAMVNQNGYRLLADFLIALFPGAWPALIRLNTLLGRT